MELTEIFPKGELKRLEEILIRDVSEEEKKDLDEGFEDVWNEISKED